MKPRSAAGRRPLPGSPFNRPTVGPVANSLEVSDRILHDRHGLGTVLSVEDGDMVCVDFGSSGRRRVRATKVTKL